MPTRAKSTGVKKGRKTFEIDRVVSIEEEPVKPVPVEVKEAEPVAGDDENRSLILHIPIPISKDSGLIDNAFRLQELSETEPEPFDPEDNTKTSQKAGLEQPIQTSISYQNSQKMENTTLSQFFGITMKPSIEDAPVVEEEEKIIPTQSGEGFFENAGYIVPDEAFSVIWRSSQKRGTAGSNFHSVCHWCCHTFTTKPVGVPMQYHRGKFWIRGHYCGYGCAVASILYDRSKWNYQPNESYALLHLLYRKTHGNSTPISFFLKPALAKETLQLFGGPLTIEEFRKATHEQDSLIECFTPPFVSLVSTVEEISIERSVSKKKVPFHSRFHQQVPEGKNPIAITEQSKPIPSIWMGSGLGGSAKVSI